MKKISPKYAIVFSAISMAAVVTYEIVRFNDPNDKDVLIVGSILMLLACVPGVVASTILHYRCWKAIPADVARTSPGLAVGFLFVPFFNFYWYFVSYLGLAEDSAKALNSKRSSRGLGIALGILSITSWTVASEELLIIPVAIAGFIVWLLFSLRMVAGANELIGRELPQASEAAEQVADDQLPARAETDAQ